MTTGHGYVAALDLGVEDQQAPPDIAGGSGVIGNYRAQFSVEMPNAYTFLSADGNVHGTHVLGIVGAVADNDLGIAGGCPTCSASMIHLDLKFPGVAAAIVAAIDRGMQVVNMSFGAPNRQCGDGLPNSVQPICDALDVAESRKVLMVGASGNDADDDAQFPASEPSVLAVGGAQYSSSSPDGWEEWVYESNPTDIGNVGSSQPGTNGVIAPGRSVISTVVPDAPYTHAPYYMCEDTAQGDESGVYGDGFSSCTGTSMAAPHVSALAGIMRSINPVLKPLFLSHFIRLSSSHASAPTADLGHGMPDALDGIDRMLAITPNTLKPLFSFYSSQRRDYFYTSVPQMATAATWGSLRPVNTPGIASRYLPAKGGTIDNYSGFPDAYQSPTPLAAVWVFATPQNPKVSSVPLAPLYRMSWKCGDPSPYPPTICATQPNASDTLYTADPLGVEVFGDWGYRLDGIEGFIYPKTIAQPPGTVRLMRKYNATRDDHAIFPETQLSQMQAEGYTQNSGSDWLGYVYPNTNGDVPAIQ